MASAPRERLAGLNAAAFRARLRDDLLTKYGCWQRASGTGLEAADWFAALADAVQAEARDGADALALCHFAFVDALDWSSTEWPTAVLARTHSVEVLRAAVDTLTPAAVSSPEAANAFCRDMRHLWRERGLRGREVMDVLRAAWTGQSRGPCLGIVGALLGAARGRQRLEEARTCAMSLAT